MNSPSVLLSEYIRQRDRTWSGSVSMTIESVDAVSNGEGSVGSGAVVPDPVAGRLGDFGFRAGEKIEWMGRAPFGEPYFFSVRGTTVALRLDEAMRMRVRVSSK